MVAGTICGEILIYSADLEVLTGQSMVVIQPSSRSVLKHMQTLLVCGGSVQCLAWSKDSRYEEDILMVYVLGYCIARVHLIREKLLLDFEIQVLCDIPLPKVYAKKLHKSFLPLKLPALYHIDLYCAGSLLWEAVMITSRFSRVENQRQPPNQ